MRGVSPRFATVRYATFVLGETVLLALALLAAIFLRLLGDPEALASYQHLVPKVAVGTLVLQLAIYYNDLYQNRVTPWRLDYLRRIGQAFLVGILMLALVYYLVPAVEVGRGILLLYLPTAALVVTAWHSIHQWAAGALSERVLILGTGISARQIAQELFARPPLGYRLVGFLGQHPAEVGRELVGQGVLGTTADLQQYVDKLSVSLIVVALEDRRGKMPIKELLACRTAGIAVEEGTSFYERLTGRVLVTSLRPSLLVFSNGLGDTRVFRSAKSVGEPLSALLLLILTAPLWALIALLIRLDSRGSVFYWQERVGFKGNRFKLAKFRTMHADAEAHTGPVWAPADGDTRVTRVGRWLRKSRLDELPQLLNIIGGDMSFIGPRPERPPFVEQLRTIMPYYDLRHIVKPGITGAAQVRFRYGSTIEDAEEKLQYDLYYIKNMSLLFDMGIALDTLKVILFGKGAR